LKKERFAHLARAIIIRFYIAVIADAAVEKFPTPVNTATKAAAKQGKKCGLNKARDKPLKKATLCT
jgi:hypothetical protein